MTAGCNCLTALGDVIPLELEGCDTRYEHVLLAEPAAAARVAESHRLMSVVVVEGVAVWSKEQLLSEVSRGLWGLASGRRDDAFDAAAAAALWTESWEKRKPLAVPEM